MQTLQTQTKKKEVTLTRFQKVKLFRKELERVIKTDMKRSPEMFHGSIRSAPAKYAREFSQHMMEKLQQGRVLVLNETVARAAADAGIGYGIDELYRYFDFDPPKPIRRAKKVEEPVVVERAESSFRGC